MSISLNSSGSDSTASPGSVCMLVLSSALDQKLESVLKLNLLMPDFGQPGQTLGNGAPEMLQNLLKAVPSSRRDWGIQVLLVAGACAETGACSEGLSSSHQSQPFSACSLAVGGR